MCLDWITVRIQFFYLDKYVEHTGLSIDDKKQETNNENWNVIVLRELLTWQPSSMKWP